MKVVEDNLKSFVALAPSAYFENLSAKDIKTLLNTKIVELLKSKTKIRMFLANTKRSAELMY